MGCLSTLSLAHVLARAERIAAQDLAEITDTAVRHGAASQMGSGRFKHIGPMDLWAYGLWPFISSKPESVNLNHNL